MSISSAPPPPTAVLDAAPGGLAGRLLHRCRFPTPSAGPVALAVSGGPDSLALVVLAAAAGLTGTAIHVDHGLRVGSAREADLVAAVAAAYGFGFEARSVRVPAGPDLEARARRARYQALPHGVLTGHTMDDQAETVLINLFRGAGLDGLAGMRVDAGAHGPGGPGQVRRPLLGLRRAETAALCREVGLTPVNDPTNADPRFVRNRVRAEVIPMLCEVAGRDVVPVLSRQAEILQEERAYLDREAAALDATDVRVLRSAPIVLRRRALRRWLRQPSSGADPESHPPSSADIERILAVVNLERVACEISGGRRVSRQAGRLRVSRAGEPGDGGPVDGAGVQPGEGAG